MKLHKLPPEMTLYTAESVVDQLKQINLKEEVVLDGSQVQFIDGCGLQILIALRKSLYHEERDMQILYPSPPLEKVLEVLGMAEIVRRDFDGEVYSDCG